MEGADTPESHAIILAGGKGVRFDAGLPKQFYEVNGRAIVYHTVEKFVRQEFIRSIVVVAPTDDLWFRKMREVLKPLAAEKEIEITAGGNTRHRSVVEGLKSLCTLLKKSRKNWHGDIVVIHDAARPFVMSTDIFAIVSCAKDYKGAGLAVPIRGTTIELDTNEILLKCCDRATHWSSEAPQAFQLGFICKCYEKNLKPHQFQVLRI